MNAAGERRGRVRVIYWNNMPAPYMVDRFNALADRDEIDLEVWFNERREADRRWHVDETGWRFRHRYLPSISVFRWKFRFPLPVVGVQADLIVSLYAEPVFVLGWVISRVRGMKTGFRVLKTFDAWVHRRRYKEWIRRSMFRLVDAVETPGEDGFDFATSSGAPAERVHICTHTVNEVFMEAGRNASAARKRELRTQFDINGVAFIYVGRLWKGKGVEILLHAHESLCLSSVGESTLVLVGDGPEEDALRRLCKARARTNVRFVGHLERGELADYLLASDVFVFPTRGDPYGLAVDEAMAVGLPIISTIAAGEIRSRVLDGVNGFLVDVDDPESLTSRMSELACDEEKRRRMGDESKRIASTRTPERWASDFCNLVRHAIHGRG